MQTLTLSKCIRKAFRLRRENVRDSKMASCPTVFSRNAFHAFNETLLASTVNYRVITHGTNFLTFRRASSDRSFKEFNIQKFMDEAESGVIYLSLGSTVEPTAFEDLGNTFVQILGRLPQRIIMKWDPKLLHSVPNNVKVQKWIPQCEVLILAYELYGLPRSQKLLEKHFHFERENMPHIKDIVKNISVTFVTNHYSWGYVKPNLPNIVNVAGLHFTPPKSLPSNMQKFMDEAEFGVVFLSLGSTVEPSALDNLGNIFIQALKNIPQRVIMKWDPKLLQNIPDNVLVQEWIPQNEVLNTADLIKYLRRADRFTNLLHFFAHNHNHAEEVLNLPEIQNIIHSRDHYDLVIAELFYLDVFLAFGYKFKAPIVAMCPMNLMFFYSWILGNPYPSSYVPNQFLWYTENMTLFTRFSNTVFNFFSDHPNCRLFITHGGLHSALESINASVPFVGIPILSDQYYNMAAAEHFGIGRMVPFEKVSVKLFSEIQDVLYNPK
ncbi:hypothetical protein V9T40_011600 [Parthenolecanium corni]|uniref:Glucuronosyltransferase n=1 Tax=Parthenolecanium corni TaxID=536013 RepID=A0AAN9XYQ8_9HEMI